LPTKHSKSRKPTLKVKPKLVPVDVGLNTVLTSNGHFCWHRLVENSGIFQIPTDTNRGRIRSPSWPKIWTKMWSKKRADSNGKRQRSGNEMKCRFAGCVGWCVLVCGIWWGFATCEHNQSVKGGCCCVGGRVVRVI
jgi:hypothetical protein